MSCAQLLLQAMLLASHLEFDCGNGDPTPQQARFDSRLAWRYACDYLSAQPTSNPDVWTICHAWPCKNNNQVLEMPQPVSLSHLSSFRQQHLNIEFSSLRSAKLEGVFVSITPGDPTLWVGVVFVRKGNHTLMRNQSTIHQSRHIHS